MEFCNDLTIYNLQKEKLRSKDATHASLLLPESPVSSPLLPQKQIGVSSPQNINDPLSLLQNSDDPDMIVLKDFLSRIHASLDVLNDPSFFKKDISHSTMQAMFVETCELEERRKKAADENQQKTVSAAVVVNRFIETIKPKDYPTLDSKQICLETDRDILPVLRDIIKLSKKVKLVDLLKVLNCNDSTTSLVKVLALQSNPASKNQAQ
jgi:hypothetical protein